MRDLRLKLIAQVDFRKNEETNLMELAKAGKVPALKRGEGVLLISMSNDQLVFVERIEEFETENGRGKSVVARVVPSQRFRLRGAK